MVTSLVSAVSNPSKPSWLYPSASEEGGETRSATSAKDRTRFFRSLAAPIGHNKASIKSSWQTIQKSSAREREEVCKRLFRFLPLSLPSFTLFFIWFS